MVFKEIKHKAEHNPSLSPHSQTAHPVCFQGLRLSRNRKWVGSWRSVQDSGFKSSQVPHTHWADRTGGRLIH